MIPYTEEDFIPLPTASKPLTFRGVQLSRSTVLRMVDLGRLKLAKFRLTGRAQGRRYLLREDLVNFINERMSIPAVATK